MNESIAYHAVRTRFLRTQTTPSQRGGVHEFARENRYRYLRLSLLANDQVADASHAVSRIWKAIQSLAKPLSSAVAE
jgi:hypothetical protein